MNLIITNEWTEAIDMLASSVTTNIILKYLSIEEINRYIGEWVHKIKDGEKH